MKKGKLFCFSRENCGRHIVTLKNTQMAEPVDTFSLERFRCLY